VEFRASDQQAIETSSGVKVVQSVPLKDGVDHHFLVTKYPILGVNAEPILVGGMAIDISEQKQTEYAIAGQNRIMERIATGSPLGEILELIVELIEEQIPDSFCSILLYDPLQNQFKFGAASSLPAEYSRAVDGTIVGPTVGSCGAAVHRREPVVVKDVMTSPLWADFRDLAVAYGFRSCWSVPIFSRPSDEEHDDHRRVLGTFAIYKSYPWEPGHDEVQMVATATYLASVAIEQEADERSLKESEQRYRALVDHAPVGIYVNIDNKFAYVNDATCRLMGADSKEQLIGTSTQDRFPKELVPLINARLDRLLNHGETVPWLTHRYQRLDGFEVEVETIGIPIQFDHRSAVQVLINDVSERKVAEEKLNAAAKRLAMLFRASPVGICISTMKEGIVLEANDIYINLCGFPSDEIIGNRTIEFGQWPDPSKRDELVAELKKYGSVKNWEVRFRRKDGTMGYSLRSFERLEVDGKDCILSVVSDITANKEIDEELRVSRQRLEVLSRQLINTQETERRHLARELHDEIGQTLTAIKMSLRRGQRNLDPDAQSTLEENVSLVDQAISRVRNLSVSLRPPQLDQLGLVAALHWVIKNQARIGGFQEDLDADIGDLQVSDDIAIVCFRITQEALTNAVRHAKPRHVHIRLRVINDELQLLIQDDGIGFDVAQARELATSGASLGLLSMQERVYLVGGQIKIDSTMGLGTKIEARFPIKPSDHLDTNN
jgi:PAS domain S-box-containing protein